VGLVQRKSRAWQGPKEHALDIEVARHGQGCTEEASIKSDRETTREEDCGNQAYPRRWRLSYQTETSRKAQCSGQKQNCGQEERPARKKERG